MFRTVHVLTSETERIEEWVNEIARRRGCDSPSEHAPVEARLSITTVYGESDFDWITFIETPSAGIKRLVSDLAAITDSLTLGLSIEPDVEWSFRAMTGLNLLGDFHWTAPAEELQNLDEEVGKRENRKLEDLGICTQSGHPGLEKLNQRMLSRSRIQSSDPHVELKYRARLSNSELVPAIPELSEELPVNLARNLPGSSAARFRRILGKPHLTVVQMAAEFAHYIHLPDPFRNVEDLERWGIRGREIRLWRFR